MTRFIDKKPHDLLLNCSNSFNIICVTEIWSTDNDIKNNSIFHLPNFDFIYQEGKTGEKGGGILIYVKNHIKLKIIKDLSASDGDSECVTFEIENKNSQNLINTFCYTPPRGAIKGLNSFLENAFKKANTENKLRFVGGGFNLNCLDYNKNLEIRTFYNQIFAHSQGATFQKQPFGQPRFLMGKLYIFGVLRHSTLWKPESL